MLKEHKRNRRRQEHFHGAAAMDFYACQSEIRHWNGCYKVVSAVLVLLLCIILDTHLVSVFIIISVGALNIIGNGIGFRNYLALLRVPIGFLFLASMAVALGISAETAGDWSISLHWFWLYVTKAGLAHALELFLKALAAVSAMYYMALSTPAGELASVLQRMHMPRLLAELMHMIYRFIFILSENHRAMKTAAVSRLGDADFKTSCTAFGQIGGNLLVLSLKKANAYYDAMVSRGYEGEFTFWEEEKPLKKWQILALVCYLAVLILLWMAEKL